MVFGGFQKLTLLDFPGKVSCTLFTKGCNFRCPFCHNAPLVTCIDMSDEYTEEEILSFLNKRQGILEGVCITGGEPLMYDLEPFLEKVKALGYKVKLDTNGSYPEKLMQLVEEGLVDYVAMDIKNTFEKYPLTAGCQVDIEKIKKSIDFIRNSGIDYEFRTTVTEETHTVEDIEKIAQYIDGSKKYFIQNFLDSGHIIGENLSPVSAETLEMMGFRAKSHVEFSKTR